MKAKNENTAIVLKIGDRFFREIKNGRIKTAWSLAGACLFGPWREDKIMSIERRLEAKGKKSRRELVQLAGAQL